VRLSPRWDAAGDVSSARVVARYAASGGYVAYRWRRAATSLALDFTGTGERVLVRLLLPEGVKGPTRVTFQGSKQPYSIEEVFGSRYVVFAVETGSGSVEVEW
jgi:hypothetical protein